MTVFVVQQPAKMDRNRQWKPIFDITPARKFGKIQFVLLRPGNIYLDMLPTVLAHMESVLKNFGDKDYLLPVGEPVAIAAAAMIAGMANGGRLNMLKWNRVKSDYEVVAIQLQGVRNGA